MCRCLLSSKSSKKLTGSLIGSMAFFLIFVGLFYTMDTSDKYTEDNTILYSATILSAETRGQQSTTHLLLSTKEHRNSWLVTADVYPIIDTKMIAELYEGNMVEFRIAEDKAQHINGNSFIEIVSLKVNGTDVFTLSDYNEVYHHLSIPPRIICGVLMALSGGIAVFCVLRIYFVKRKSK